MPLDPSIPQLKSGPINPIIFRRMMRDPNLQTLALGLVGPEHRGLGDLDEFLTSDYSSARL